MDSKIPAVVTREEISTNQAVIKILRRSFDTYYITARTNALGEFEGLADFIRRYKGKIVTQDVFGKCNLHEDGIRSLSNVFGSIDWPITWIEGQNCNGYDSCGTQLYVISGANVEQVSIDGRAVGGVYEDEDAVYCLLGGIIPSDSSQPRSEQTIETFQKIESALQSVEMDFGNVVRTWLYLDDILSWYEVFNKVRGEFFRERNIYDGILPASTGIGVGNPDGTAVIAGALAIKPKTGRVHIEAVPSPLQCSALDYGSSFSRALEVTLPDLRRLYISGTASIELSGKTAHIGDIGGQISLTMQVVQAILQSRGMDWSDVNRAIAYFRRWEDFPMLDHYCRQRGLSTIPIAMSHADICRDDLLFEIEVDAAQPV
jgi:enamine deaminase RidA (YjgF/YER057c/UK114 family)